MLFVFSVFNIYEPCMGLDALPVRQDRDGWQVRGTAGGSKLPLLVRQGEVQGQVKADLVEFHVRLLLD